MHVRNAAQVDAHSIVILYEVDCLAEWPTEGRLIQVDRVMEMKSEISTIVYKN